MLILFFGCTTPGHPSVVSPLDVLKIRFQTQNALTRSTHKTYDGTHHTIVVVIPMATINLHDMLPFGRIVPRSAHHRPEGGSARPLQRVREPSTMGPFLWLTAKCLSVLVCPRLSVSMLREMTFSSTRMGLYEPIRNYLVGPQSVGSCASHLLHSNQLFLFHAEIALSKKILAGLLSGAIAAALFNPTDVLKV